MTSQEMEAPSAHVPMPDLVIRSSRPERLDRGECLRLLRAKGTGRLILGLRVPPVAVPVSFSVHDRRIVARVPTAAVTGIHWPATVTLEADELVAGSAPGWSVTVLGGCELAAATAGVGGPDAQTEVTVEADLVTGRRFGAADPRRASCS